MRSRTTSRACVRGELDVDGVENAGLAEHQLLGDGLGEEDTGFAGQGVPAARVAD